ncbi:hypothetical protein HZB04_03440 [Candidatus Wolfebacteria bacterium]|nr:hypothetical protein [Candidatus Wolfebacteria bacterium]
MKDIIKNILEYAVNAPSGNNSQPWKFKVKENKIYIYNVPDGDITPYNFDQKGSYIAHGALIENISIISLKYGYSANIEIFPNKNHNDIVAIITLKKTELKENQLFDHIFNRATNRRIYQKTPLKSEHKEEILKIHQEIDKSGKIKLIEDIEKIKKVAWALGLHERLIFENEMIHNIVFSSVLWSEKENAEKRKGLYIKTRFPDMPSFMLPIMKIFKSWLFVNIVNKIGLAKKIQKQSAESCISSSALCAILIDEETNEAYLRGGRLLQRIWLTATKLGLSIQPMTGIPYLARRILKGDSSGFLPKEVEFVKQANKTINDIFNENQKTIIIIFRIGYDSKPPIKTLKLPPNIVFEE